MVWGLWREESGERKENGLRNQESRVKSQEPRKMDILIFVCGYLRDLREIKKCVLGEK